MLKLLNYIIENEDWEEQLSKAPYRLKIKRSAELVMLHYKNRSDFSIDIVKECRGIILDERNGFLPICAPFFKFFDYDDPKADRIDWKTARVLEKIDGSLIKVWNHKGVWCISTNKSLNAQSASTNNNEDTFYNIFQKAWTATGKKFKDLNPEYTYMFEVVSPQSRVVVPYKETKLYHTGTRNNKTLQELHLDIGIEKPKEYIFSTIEECVEAANKLDKYHEGFVVVDSFWRRIKVKSSEYIDFHKLINDISTEKRLIDIFRAGEEAKVVSFFPEYSEMLSTVNERIESLITHIEQEHDTIKNFEYATQKELAETVKKTICPACLFSVLCGKSKSVREYIYSRTSHKIIEYLNKHQPNRERDFWRAE
jgi:hypothetical protein